MRHALAFLFGTTLIAGAIAACGSDGDTGAAGAPGAPGAAGGAGPAGPAGPAGTSTAPAPGKPIVISAGAKAGLALSPVVLDLAGKSEAEIEAIGQGSYLVNSVAMCNNCHVGTNMAGDFLGGGVPFPLNGSGDKVYARNLTPDATTGLKLTEAEFIAAIRTGRDHLNAGQQLIVMPWPALRWMSDGDIKAMYAYLRVIPGANNPIPADIKGALASLAPVPFPATYNEGDVERPLPPATQPDPDNTLRGLAISPLAAPAGFSSWSPTEQAQYGRGSYLVNSAGVCNLCHTSGDRDANLKIFTDRYLSGGSVWDYTVLGVDSAFKIKRSMNSNLTGENNGYQGTFVQFVDGMTSNTKATQASRPGIAFPHPPGIGNASLDDLGAIYTYITRVPRRTGANDKATQGPAKFCTANADCTGAGETCNTATKECIGAACNTTPECPACQTCEGNACAAPTTSCPTSGI